MTARLQAKIEANRERMDAKIEANQEKTGISQEQTKAPMNRHQERMEATVHSMRAWQKEMMDAYLGSKEPTSVETESQSEYPEVPKEDAAVKSFGAPEKWHGDRHLTIEHHEEPKEQTQGKGGSQKSSPPPEEE
jgi:hypothetical protein